MYTRDKPFPTIVNEYQVTTRVQRGERPPRPTHETGKYMPTTLWDVVQLCWAPDRMDRPHISEVLGKIRPSFQESSIRTGDVLALSSPPNTLDVDEFKRRHPTLVSLLYWSPTFLIVLYFIDWVINFHAYVDDRYSYYMKLILISRPIQISIIIQFLFAQALSNCIKQF